MIAFNPSIEIGQVAACADADGNRRLMRA